MSIVQRVITGVTGLCLLVGFITIHNLKREFEAVRLTQHQRSYLEMIELDNMDKIAEKCKSMLEDERLIRHTLRSISPDYLTGKCFTGGILNDNKREFTVYIDRLPRYKRD